MIIPEVKYIVHFHKKKKKKKEYVQESTATTLDRSNFQLLAIIVPHSYNYNFVYS